MLQVEIVWQVDCKACCIFFFFLAFDGYIDSWGCWLILCTFKWIYFLLTIPSCAEVFSTCCTFADCSIVWSWLSMVCFSGSRTATLYAGASGKSERRTLQEWSTFLWIFIHGGSAIFFNLYVNFSNATSNVILYCCLYRDVQ